MPVGVLEALLRRTDKVVRDRKTATTTTTGSCIYAVEAIVVIALIGLQHLTVAFPDLAMRRMHAGRGATELEFVGTEAASTKSELPPATHSTGGIASWILTWKTMSVLV